MQKVFHCLDDIKQEYCRSNKIKFWFYSLMLFGIISFWFCAFFTHGETLMRVMFVDKKDTFMDFFNSIQYGRQPYESGVIYPPLANVLYGITGHFVPMSAIARGPFAIRNSQAGALILHLYLVFSNILFTLLVLKIKKGSNLEKYIFLCIIFLSTPFLYVFERGNLCFLTLIFLTMFLLWYNSEKAFMRYIAYVCLAIATAFKIYPIVFGLLLLRGKKIKEILICVITTAVIFILPIAFLGGPKNLVSLFRNVFKATKAFQNNVGYGFKVNITNTIDLIVDALKLPSELRICGPILVGIFAFIGVILILFADFKSPWKLIAIPTLMMILLPGFSFTYVIIFLAIPLLMFLDEKKKPSKLDYVYMILFVLAFIPIVEIKANLFGRLCNYYHRLNLTTAIETFSITTMAILIYFEGIKNIIFKIKKSRTLKKGG